MKAATGQDQSTLLEIFQYPGFEEDRVTPLPFDVSLQNQVMQRILPKRFTHPRQVRVSLMEFNLSLSLSHSLT